MNKEELRNLIIEEINNQELFEDIIRNISRDSGDDFTKADIEAEFCDMMAENLIYDHGSYYSYNYEVTNA